MKKAYRFWNNLRGSAVIEATILFPMMIMILCGLVLLSTYLPTRSRLQQATQFAATAIATEKSDTWLYYDEDTMKYTWAGSKSELPNVYVSFIQGITGNGKNDQFTAEKVVETFLDEGAIKIAGELDVDCTMRNFIIYKEISVTATKHIPLPLDLSFIGFPEELTITVTSTAVVQDGDEFVRSMDIAGDFFNYLDEKYHITSNAVFTKIKEAGSKINQFLGI